MNSQNRKSKIKLNVLAAFLLCGIFLVITVGSAYAHYETTVSKDFKFQYKAETGQVYIRSVDPAEIEQSVKDEESTETTDEETEVPENEQTDIGSENNENQEENVSEETANNFVENVYSAHFVLANGTDLKDYCEYDQKATLSMVATVGLGNPNDFIVMLIDGGSSYTAICTEVLEGTEVYNTYGPGWVYQFYDSTGEEVEWQFPGTQYIERKMEIVVIGASEMPAVLNLIVQAKPGE
jgi:hypothetical protein